MGILEPITHKKEIEEIYSEADSIQKNSINRFTLPKRRRNQSSNNTESKKS